MAKKKSDAPKYSDIESLFADVKKESDRGAVLICAAWLDDALTENLRNCLVDDTTVVNKLFGFDQPLGTFSAKIAIAYCLGLIDEDMRKDLDTIRGIRNDFSHVRDSLSFATQSVTDRCNRLTTADKLLEASGLMGMHGFSTVRDRFLISSTLIVGYLIRVSGSRGFAPKGTDSAFRMYLDRLVEKGERAEIMKIIDSLERHHSIADTTKEGRQKKSNR